VQPAPGGPGVRERRWRGVGLVWQLGERGVVERSAVKTEALQQQLADRIQARRADEDNGVGEQALGIEDQRPALAAVVGAERQTDAAVGRAVVFW
jgi:hypothetical protein